jgi:hypothetical protein
MGAWEHGSMGAWEHGSMGAWEHGSMGAWEHGSMGMGAHKSTALLPYTDFKKSAHLTLLSSQFSILGENFQIGIFHSNRKLGTYYNIRNYIQTNFTNFTKLKY